MPLDLLSYPRGEHLMIDLMHDVVMAILGAMRILTTMNVYIPTLQFSVVFTSSAKILYIHSDISISSHYVIRLNYSSKAKDSV
jgi:hypothetical protein